MKNAPSTALNPSKQPPQPGPSQLLPPLVAALTRYDRLQRRRFHVPAHAGFSMLPPEWDLLRDPYRYDLTELDGLDVLSEPSGCIQEAQAQVAKIFGVAHSYFLLNGASVGLMAAMLAAVQPGDKVLLPRNVHRSVLSGLILTGAMPVWFLPERLTDWGLWGGVTVTQVEAELARYPDVKALFLTSPTYEGIGSDINALTVFCRERGILLVVDEAHGSLWNFSERLPVSACRAACDVVIHSMHKSGGSLTQGALAHLPHASRIDPDVFQQALNTLQTTSPSYLLMASLDAACHYLVSDGGQARIANLLNHVASLRNEFSAALKTLRLFEPLDSRFWDPCKFYFASPLTSGEDWGCRLEEERQLAFESVSSSGVLYLANLGLEPADFDVFQKILLEEEMRQRNETLEQQAKRLESGYSREENPHQQSEPIDRQVEMLESAASSVALTPQQVGARESQVLPDEKQPGSDPSVALPELAMLPREAFFAPGQRVASEAAVGRVAKETIVHCPPGIPVLLPGERIRPAHVPLLPEAGVLVIR